MKGEGVTKEEVQKDLPGPSRVQAPTIYDVAKLAGVSPSTVSRVLSGSNYPVRAELRAAIRNAARELNYRPNRIARSLKNVTAQDIGVIVPSISNPYYHDLIKGVEDVAYAHQIGVFLCSSDRQPDREREYLRRLFEKRALGVVAAVISEDDATLVELRRWEHRIVTFDQTLDFSGIYSVRFDNVEGGYLATEHLLQLGHRRIAYLSGPLTRRSRRELLMGYQHAHEDFGVAYYDELIVSAESEYELRSGVYECAIGQDLTKRVMRLGDPPTAIFAANDMIALGVLRSLAEMGCRVPDDVSVVGFDDVWLAEMVSPPLTTVSQPKYEMGRLAAEALLRRATSGSGGEDADSAILKPHIVVRASTAAPRG